MESNQWGYAAAFPSMTPNSDSATGTPGGKRSLDRPDEAELAGRAEHVPVVALESVRPVRVPFPAEMRVRVRRQAAVGAALGGLGELGQPPRWADLDVGVNLLHCVDEGEHTWVN